MSKVAVVIPHLERLEDTAACCRDLERQSRAPDLVVVVDNGSRSHSEDELKSVAPNAEVLRQGSNRGFARGVNIGMRHAIEKIDPDYMWVLNNDTRLPAATLEKLLAKALSDARCGIIATPLFESDEGKERRVSGGSRLIKL